MCVCGVREVNVCVCVALSRSRSPPASLSFLSSRRAPVVFDGRARCAGGCGRERVQKEHPGEDDAV
eukprot:735209-Rhodomonas_salina.1